MIIAQIGKYALRPKTFLGNHTYTTHDIEIVKYYDDYHCATIADFEVNYKDPYESDLRSCGLRLIEEVETTEDIQAVKQLSKIGYDIICTTQVNSQYCPDFN